MHLRLILAGLAIAAGGLFSVSSAEAQGIGGMNPYAWHGSYYHVAYGQPVALIVPPTARRQYHYSWGVPSARITPIYAQFSRFNPGYVTTGAGFRGTPRWPSTTDQFGVYYVRGPW